MADFFLKMEKTEMRGVNRCAVKLCTNNSKNTNCSFFKFPTDKNRSDVWVKACNREDLLEKHNLHNLSYKVCGIHFENRMFSNDSQNRLQKDACPTIFPFKERTCSSSADELSQVHTSQINVSTPFVHQRNNKTKDNHIEENNDIINEDTTETNTTYTVNEAPVDDMLIIPSRAKRPKLFHPVQTAVVDTNDTPVLMSYIVQNQNSERIPEIEVKDPIDIFFENIKEKIKRFTPYYRNIAEIKIFTLVQEMELEQIVQSQQEQESSHTLQTKSEPYTNETEYDLSSIKCDIDDE